MDLWLTVVNAVGAIPVAVAVTIADGGGLAAALSLGAAGVLMGMRFAESLWAETRKKHIIAAGDDETERTQVFDIVRMRRGRPSTRPPREECVLDPWHPREDRLRDNRAEVKAE